MPRVKRGVMHLKRRKNILRETKGYRWGRKNLIKVAKVAVLKAGVNAYRDRKNNKRNFRSLWILRLSAALKLRNPKFTYSRFIAALKKQKIEIDRKILSQIAQKHPKIFDALLTKISFV